MRKKKKYLIWGITVIALSGLAIICSHYPNLFSTHSHLTKRVSSKEQQLAYLKKHENEIKEFIKSQNPKIESVQIDWDQTRWEDIGNGTPKGAGKVVSIFGGFNHLKTSDWNVLIEIKNGKIDMERMGISNGIRLEGQLFD